MTKRIAQELIVQEKIAILAGFGLTPLALATAPVATEAKVPMVVMCAGTSIIPQRSPFIVRTGFTLPQNTAPIADWAAKNKIKKVVTLVADYAPGSESEKTFVKRFGDAGGTIVDSIRSPLSNPDFAPFLQRAKDAKPDALFVFVLREGTAVMSIRRARLEGRRDRPHRSWLRGRRRYPRYHRRTGARGDKSTHSSTIRRASLPREQAYVDAFMKANNGMRPNFMSVGGIRRMHLIYEALKKTGGATDGEKLVEAMKGMAWVSPRGPMSIDPATRDVVQNVYIRKVEMKDGHYWNVEFDKVENFKDPGV